MKKLLFITALLVVSGNIISQNSAKKSEQLTSSNEKEVKLNSSTNEKQNSTNTTQETPSVLSNERILKPVEVVPQDTIKNPTGRKPKDQNVQQLEGEKKKSGNL